MENRLVSDRSTVSHLVSDGQFGTNEQNAAIPRMKWRIYALLLIVYAITQHTVFCYVPLLIEFANVVLRMGNHASCTIEKIALSFLILCIAMPDNYSVILGSLVVFLAFSKKSHIKENQYLYLASLIAYCMINALVNAVPLNNIVVAAIYNAPTLFLAIGLSGLKQSDNSLLKYVLDALKWLTLVQAACVIAYAVTHVSIVAAYNDMDWVTGSMGEYQANTLMIVESFSLIVFAKELIQGHRENIKWCVMSLILVISTTSITYLMLFVCSVAVVFVFSMQISLIKKLIMLLMGCLAAICFVYISPTWITNELGLMTNATYAQHRIGKIQYYERTFIELPKKEGLPSALFGTGLGTYSSRAALTCSGGYIDSYDKFFIPYTSYERSRFVGDEDRRLGLASFPDSSIVAIQGELGYVGMAFLTIFLLCLGLRAKDPFSKIALLYLILLLFFDNVLEYAKFMGMYFIAFNMCINTPGELSARLRNAFTTLYRE